MNYKDYYKTLGVARDADEKTIKSAYRKLARKHHPDVNKGSAERFKEISEANNVLGDPEKRKQYDEMRRLGAFAGFGGRTSSSPGSSRPGGFGNTGPGQPGAGNFTDFDVGGIGGLGDLFSSMFGQGAQRPGRRGGPERGQTVETVIEVPFRVAATGGKVPVEMEVGEECGTCNGSGAAPGAQLRPCAECAGRGVISFGQGSFAVNRPCPVCMGRGQVPTERCPTCNGSGEARARRKVLIAVPAGAESGTKVRMRGQGGKGAAGGQPGDLVITFQVLPDKFYKREGLDLVATVPINIAQATLGSKITVKTLDGKKITLRIPPGTSAGKRFRVSGQGIEKEGKKGDLFVEVTITVPEKLSETQEKAMREFAEAGGLKF